MPWDIETRRGRALALAAAGNQIDGLQRSLENMAVTSIEAAPKVPAKSSGSKRRTKASARSSKPSKKGDSRWCFEEEEQLLELRNVTFKGLPWKVVSQLIGRSDVTCRNRHHYVTEGKKKKRALPAVALAPPKNWTPLSPETIAAALRKARQSNGVSDPEDDSPSQSDVEALTETAEDQQSEHESDCSSEVLSSDYEQDLPHAGLPCAPVPRSKCPNSWEDFTCPGCDYSRLDTYGTYETEGVCVYCARDFMVHEVFHRNTATELVFCVECEHLMTLTWFFGVDGSEHKTTCWDCRKPEADSVVGGEDLDVQEKTAEEDEEMEDAGMPWVWHPSQWHSPLQE